MNHFDRRSFLSLAGRSGAALMMAGMAPRMWPQWRPPTIPADEPPPNILIILVDQWRYPQWFPDQPALDALLPNTAALRQGAVNFTQHFAAATACTPSRACMLTGLYTHQHFCMITEASELHPDFPTFGDFLRQFGYATQWFGKWHVADDGDGGSDPPYDYLDPYGFTAYTWPDPHGAPGQGMNVDGDIATQAATWLTATPARSEEPWCTVVSLVNPHDIMFYPRFIPAGEDNPPAQFADYPPNYETATAIQTHKPSLQAELIKVANRQFGQMGHAPANKAEWVDLLDTYLFMEQMVDTQIGVVMTALESVPAVKNNTVVIFTCDHGEYGGSHGLRGKGGAAYDEAIHVPFIVKDFSGKLQAQPGDRAQLTSHVDLAPLLLTIAYGDNGWRTINECSHLANRLDMLELVRDPNAAGRPYILHTTDEPGTEEKEGVDYAPFDSSAPWHVTCLRTAEGKFSTYSFWRENSTAILSEGQETECYDYATEAGRKEMANISNTTDERFVQLQQTLEEDALYAELRAPLPYHLTRAQVEARGDYLAYLGQLGWQQHLPFVAGGAG